MIAHMQVKIFALSANTDNFSVGITYKIKKSGLHL